MLVEKTEKYIKPCRFWQTLNSLSLPLLKPRWTSISEVVSDSEKQTEEIQKALLQGNYRAIKVDIFLARLLHF